MILAIIAGWLLVLGWLTYVVLLTKHSGGSSLAGPQVGVVLLLGPTHSPGPATGCKSGFMRRGLSAPDTGDQTVAVFSWYVTCYAGGYCGMYAWWVVTASWRSEHYAITCTLFLIILPVECAAVLHSRQGMKWLA